MIKFPSLLIGLIAVMVFSGCDSRVHTAFDQTADFTKYKTFCWMDGCEFTITGPSYLNDEKVRDDVQKAIIENFREKGLIYDSDNPDLLLGFRVTLEHETAVIYHRPEDEPSNYRPLPDQEYIDLLKGTIVIDIVDKKEAKMVWRSEAMGYMEQFPEPTYKNIYRGTKKALKDYPPKTKRD